MTVKELWKHCLKGIKKKATILLKNVPEGRIGVDISVWLHILCSIDDVVLTMLSSPAYAPDNVLRCLKNKNRELKDAKKTLVYCFDGFGHPMKMETTKNRRAENEKAKQWLCDFYERGKAGETIGDNE
jgi:hypothetical protein